MKKETIKSVLEDLGSLMEIWSKFRKYFLRSFAQDPIAHEEEEDFLEVKSNIARYQRVIRQKIQDELYYGADQMQELLRQSISISHLRTLPVNDRQELYKKWHATWVALTRTLGAFKFFDEVGYVHVPKKGEAALSVADLKRGGKKLKTDENTPFFKSKVFLAIAALVIIGIGLLIYMNQ